jgi:LuxR family maltose regulon positive regulatory protein
MKGYMYVRRWVDDGQVRMWNSQGELEKLEDWILNSGMTISDELDFLRDVDHIILARALLLSARAEPQKPHLSNALSLLGRLKEMTETCGWNGKLIEILVLQALALKLSNNDEDALLALNKALILAEAEDYKRTFIDEGQEMQVLLEELKLRLKTKSQSSKQDSQTIFPYIDELLGAFPPEESTITPLQSTEPAKQNLVEPLSNREMEVLRMLNSDLSGPEMAAELTIALSTVRYHTNNIYGKLGVNNRRAAVRKAKELDLL